MRNQTIDSIRFIAISFIVILHTSSLAFSTQWLGEVLNHSVRFAVPFFFSIAGYLFYKKVSASPDQIWINLTKYLYRLIYVYVFWYFIYALFSFYSPTNWSNLINHGALTELKSWASSFSADFLKQKLTFLFAGGRGFHLWFLPALGIAISILAIFESQKKFTLGLVFAIALFVIALLGSPYKNTLIGLNISFEPRNGPFFSTLFVFIGAWMAKVELKKSVLFCTLMIAIGFALSLLEIFYLKNYSGLVISNCSYVVGTLLFGSGVTLLALSNPSSEKQSWLAVLGKYAMGIYLSHVLIIWFLIALDLWPHQDIAKFILSLSLSLIFVWVISKIPLVRKIVS